MSAISKVMASMVVPVILACMIGLPAAHAEEGALKTGSIELRDDLPYGVYAFATLLRGERIVRTTDVSGSTVLRGLQEGDYVLKLEAPGYKTLVRQIHVSSEQPVVLRTTLEKATAPASGARGQ